MKARARIAGTNRVQIASAIEKKIQTDDDFTKKALMNLYDLQESKEKQAKEDLIVNARGFCNFDASVLSTAAQKLQNKKFSALSEDLRTEIRRRVLRYSRQLVDVVYGKLPGNITLEMVQSN